MAAKARRDGLTMFEKYRFHPDQLNPEARPEGISAVIPVKNGEDFIERAIRSHIDHYDEIVVVHNQCTDQTVPIVERLTGEFPHKLRVLHYEPRAYPPASADNMKEPPNSVHSSVNYANWALAQSRYAIVVTLDDDHIAMPRQLTQIVAAVRADGLRKGMYACVSGINLAVDNSGRCGVLVTNPFVGSGDHGFFRVTRETVYSFSRQMGRRNDFGFRRFFGLAYWHLKHLKKQSGFANYEISSNPGGRWERKQREFYASLAVVPFEDLGQLRPSGFGLFRAASKLGLPLPARIAIKAGQWSEVTDRLTDLDRSLVRDLLGEKRAAEARERVPS
jgi:cellulose synthase/poly-beta-1,6-N-acetylglucosamine synthase-like glycosyltransferase